MRRRAKPARAKAKAKARLSVARKSPKSEASTRGPLEKRLAEALEQQAATSEILRVISSSQTDVQPVFDAIVRNAMRLCDADQSYAARFDGEMLHPLAFSGFSAESLEMLQRMFPMRPRGDLVMGRAALTRAPASVPDTLADSNYSQTIAVSGGWRTTMAVPMLRDGNLIGVIAVGRVAPRAFPDQHIELLKTFADQAVIAIENVRLFTELDARNRDLTEALEQQTATAEILRVISSSPTDVQPVFDTIVRSAVKLCDGLFSALYRFDGELHHLAAHYNYAPEALEEVSRVFPARATRALFTGRAILERAVVHIPDVELDEEFQYPELYRAIGFRSGLFVPMLRKGAPIGVIVAARATPGKFSASEIKLLETFADQAVIAIENVRLFSELQEKNYALTAAHAQVTEALEQQTATSEILRVISSSPTDVQPVFETIADSAMRLFDALGVAVVRYDGELISMAAARGGAPGSAVTATERLRASHRPIAGFPPEQAVLTKTMHHVVDVDTDPSCSNEFRRHARERGFRSVLCMPMLRGDDAVGVIVVSRAQPGAFSTAEVDLLHTFADQAVIAIENVRLLNETKEALEQQTATAEILKVISSSPTDIQPVLDVIGRNAVRLCNGYFCNVSLSDGEWIHLRATHNLPPEWQLEAATAYPAPLTGDMRTAVSIRERRVVHILDMQEDPGVPEASRRRAEITGYRTWVAVPMVASSGGLGAIAVFRREREAFSEREIALLQTFADQAVIAIENVRLFKELEARTAELTRSVAELRALGEVSRAVSSTLDVETVLDTIVSRARQLAGSDGCAIFEYDEATEMFYVRAAHNYNPALVDRLRAMPLRKGEGAMGRAAETGEAVQIPDITVPGAYQSPLRDVLIGAGFRALLSVPLLREDQIIGSLSLNRRAPGEFAPEVIEVLKTFATQSALAIQNARLFRELADKSRQLEVASQHKSEFLANMSHELRTPLNAIIGFSEVLTERMFGELNEKQDEYLKDIHASGTHLLSLINDILDLSKIEAGRMELELTDFSLPAAIDSAVTLVRERAARREITLRTILDERVGEVRGDERKIRQVALNLLSNAIKFTPEGGRIEVRTAALDGSVEVSVSDTGVGIAPEDQVAVFEEFRQVGAGAAKHEGTGLGLALCRKFVELHGGSIRVESQVGAGSTFTFRIPIRREE